MEADFRNVIRWAMARGALSGKLRRFYPGFSKSKCLDRPLVFETQTKTHNRVGDTVKDASFLQNLGITSDQHATKSGGPDINPGLRPNISSVLSVWAQQKAPRTHIRRRGCGTVFCIC